VQVGRKGEERIVRLGRLAGIGHGGGRLATRPPVADRVPGSGACFAWSLGGRVRATVLDRPIKRLIWGHSRR